MQYEANFSPTVDDVLTAIHMHNQQRDDKNRKFLVCIGIGVVIVFGIAAYLLHAIELALGGIFMAVFMTVASRLMRWPVELGIRIEDKIRRRSKEFKPKELKFRFTDDGVEFSNGVVRSNYTWNELTKSWLDERGVLLYLGSQGYYFVPSGAFVGGNFPLQELKLLMSQKIKSA